MRRQKERSSKPEIVFLEDSHTVEVQVPNTWRLLQIELFKADTETRKRFKVFRRRGETKCLSEEKGGVQIVWKEEKGQIILVGCTTTEPTLSSLQRSLQQLVQVQQNQQWNKYTKSPEVSKTGNRNEEL